MERLVLHPANWLSQWFWSTVPAGLHKRCPVYFAEVTVAVGSLDLAGNSFNEFRFCCAVWRAIGSEDLVEPDGRLAIRVRVLPGVPRQVGLRLSLHQSPVDRRDVVTLGQWQYPFKSAAVAARHVFRT